MKIIPLGTNGFFPSFNRQTACYAVPLGKVMIILDAGSGLFRFAEPEGLALLNKFQTIHLYLSHFHLDHTFGFYGSDRLFAGKEVKVFSQKALPVMSEYMTLPNFPKHYCKKHPNFSWQYLKEGIVINTNYSVQVLNQKHRNLTSFSYLFDFGLAYVTDGEPSEEVIDFVRGSKLLLHEHGKLGDNIKSIQIKDQIIEGHVTSIGAAQIAKKANVEKLVLIHHHPFSTNDILKRQLLITKKFFKNTQLAEDNKII